MSVERPFKQPCICSVEKALELLGIRLIEGDNLPERAWGLYSHELQIVAIDSALTHTQRLATLLHELEHVKHGHDGRQPQHIEDAINLRVAERLVDPQRHTRAAERYPEQPWARARNLSVPRWVLDTWEKHHAPHVAQPYSEDENRHV